MDKLKWVLAGLIIGFVLTSLREILRTGRFGGTDAEWLAAPGVEEPILGYDGMDQETLLEWIESAELDSMTVRNMIRYEEANLGREPVLTALTELAH